MTTGASNDFMQVSRVARQMVERFGFSKKIGQVAIGGPGGNPFLGQQVNNDSHIMSMFAQVIKYLANQIVYIRIADVIPERLLHGDC